MSYVLYKAIKYMNAEDALLAHEKKPRKMHYVSLLLYFTKNSSY